MWRKTGLGNTFEATFWVIAYQVQTKPPGAPSFQLSKVHYTGSTNAIWQYRWQFGVIINHYNSSGDEINIDRQLRTVESQGRTHSAGEGPSSVDYAYSHAYSRLAGDRIIEGDLPRGHTI